MIMKYKINITKKNIKTIRVSVKSGTLLISAPLNVSNDYIYKFIEDNKKDIYKMIEVEENKLYQNNLNSHIIYLFGEKLIYKEAVKIKNEKELENFYRKNLLNILPEIFNKYNKLTGLYQVEYKVRKMTARWGTCYPSRGLININLYLAKRSLKEIELVVLHELIHLKVQNHGRDFYNEIKKYINDYNEIAIKLNS